MAASLIRTLKPIGGALSNAILIDGFLVHTPCGSAELCDGDDSSWSGYVCGVLTDIAAPSAHYFVEFAAEPYVLTGFVIESLRIRLRAKRTSFGTPAPNELYFILDGVRRAGPYAPANGSFNWFEGSLTTNPATGLPWAEGDLIGHTYGWECVIAGTIGGDDISHFITELEAQVWGEVVAPSRHYFSPAGSTLTLPSDMFAARGLMDGVSVTDAPPADYDPEPDPNGYYKSLVDPSRRPYKVVPAQLNSPFDVSPYPAPGNFAQVLSVQEAIDKLSATCLTSLDATNVAAVQRYQSIPAAGPIAPPWVEPHTGFDWLYYGGGASYFHVVVALHSMPEQLESPDEIHAFLSLFAPGRAEFLRFGITPSGRLGVRLTAKKSPNTTQTATILSPIAQVQADSQFHTYSIHQYTHQTGGVVMLIDQVGLFVDGSVVVFGEPGYVDYVGSEIFTDSDYTYDRRAMLFNSPDGLARFNHSIAAVSWLPQDYFYVIPFDEGDGNVIRGHGVDDQPPGQSLLSPNPLDIRAFDPNEFGFAPKRGTAASGQIVWNKRPAYLARDPLATIYRPRSAAAPVS